MPNAKISDVFSRIPIAEIIRFRALLLIPPTIKYWVGSKEVILKMKKNLIKVVDRVDFSNIDSLMENLPLLLFYFRDYDEIKKSLEEYLEQKGIDINTLQEIDQSTISNLTFAMSNFPFITPEIIFTSDIKKLIELYHKIRELYPKFDPYGSHRTMAFDLAKAIQALIKSYRTWLDISKIMQPIEGIDEIDAGFVEWKADVMSLVSPSNFL